MKTAQKWMEKLYVETSGLRAADIEAIQSEAYKAGQTMAVEVAQNYIDNLATNSEGQNIAGFIRDEIISVRDMVLTEPPF